MNDTRFRFIREILAKATVCKFEVLIAFCYPLANFDNTYYFRLQYLHIKSFESLYFNSIPHILVQNALILINFS